MWVFLCTPTCWGDIGFHVFTARYGAIPFEIVYGVDAISPTPVPLYLTLLSSMFMHGGLVHLGGNMLYLWIFGNKVEDAMGHARFLFFYLVCGVIATLAHVFSDPASTIPMVGASGAIAGILGGVLGGVSQRADSGAGVLLYPPRARADCLGRGGSSSNCSTLQMIRAMWPGTRILPALSWDTC